MFSEICIALKPRVNAPHGWPYVFGPKYCGKYCEEESICITCVSVQNGSGKIRGHKYQVDDLNSPWLGMTTPHVTFISTAAMIMVLTMNTIAAQEAFPSSEKEYLSGLIPGDAIAEAEVNRLIVEYSKQIKANPNESEFYIKRGGAYLQGQRFDKAIQDFSEAIRLSDADLAYFGRGMALGRDGLINEGVKDLSVYIRRHPLSSIAYTKRGVRYLWKGEIGRAKNDFLKAISIDAGNAEAHDDLGVIYARAGDYDNAIQYFKAAIRLEPTYHKAYHNLALTYYLTGREQQALTIIDHAIKLRPGARDSLLLKAQLFRTLGRHQEAVMIQSEAESLPEEGWSERMPVN